MAGAQVAVGVRRSRPVDVELATDAAPVGVRDAATRVARARTQSPVGDIQMLAGLLEVLDLQNLPLGKRNAGDLHLGQVVEGLVGQFFVGLNSVPDPHRIGFFLGNAVFAGDNLVQALVGVFPAPKELFAKVVGALRRHAFGHHNQPVKAVLLFRNHEVGEVHGNAEVAVKPFPVGDKVEIRI